MPNAILDAGLDNGCVKSIPHTIHGTGILTYTLGVQRPLNKCSFRKDHYFRGDLQSTIPGDYIFNGL